MASFQEEDETIIIVDSEDATYIEVIEEAVPSIVVDGVQGPQGVQGSTGPSGPAGPTGSVGATGSTGPAGATGAGVTGATGPQGPTGASGPAGVTGVGITGATGPQGATGVTGGIGATGSIGETGPQGQTGSQGATGPKGELAGLSWTYQINTVTSGDRDPGNDNVGFVTLPYYNATQIVVDDNPYGINTTLHELFLNVQSAYLTLTSQSDPYIYATWKVTSCVDGTVDNETADGSYVIFNVDASNMGYGSITNGELVTLSLSIIGPQGATGASGPTGASGSQGSTGSTGPIGITGPQGSSGASGPAGATGSAGATGTVGATGPQGSTGPAGPTGANALWNFTGAYNIGASYAVGDVATYGGETWYRIDSHGGNTGDTPVEGLFWTLLSASGDIGSTGPTGSNGATGPSGAAGATGPVGATGSQGLQGIQGFTGAVGATGSAGSAGATGVTGSTGPQGATGAESTTIALATKEPTGHTDKTQSTMSFTNSGPTARTFTITPVGASFEVWCAGTKYTITSAQSVTIPDTTGLYYIYFEAGALGAQTTYFNWDSQAPTAYVYWNASTSKAEFFADERHGVTLDWATHEYLHRTRGAALASGFSISGYTVSGTGANAADAQAGLAGGTFFDEDLEVQVVASATPTANTWEQNLAFPMQVPVFWLSGTEWQADTPTTYPLKQGSARAQYNLLTGSTWSAEEAGNSDYVISWIVATNNLNYPIMVILGQESYGSHNAARNALWEDLTLTNFPVFEFRPLYKLIFQTATSYANAPSARLRDVQDIRGMVSIGSGTTTSDHGLLNGLADDDHTQYALADGSRGSFIQSTIVDAKGDLIVGTADNTAARLPVGETSGHVLTVDSTTTEGIKWAAAAGVGPSGPTGPQGATGVQGATGSAGTVGATGATGPAGANGSVGATGSTGPAGATGSTGTIIVASRGAGSQVNEPGSATSLLASTITLPVCAAGDIIRITGDVGFVQFSGTSRTMSLIIKIGSTSILTFATPSMASNATARAGHFDVAIRVGSTTSEQASGILALNALSPAVIYGTAAETISSGTLALDILGGAVVGGVTQNYTLQYVVVEKITA